MYKAFRLAPWNLQKSDKETIRFRKSFEKLHGAPPTGAISLISYSTVMAAITPVLKLNTKEIDASKILEAFQSQRAKIKNYARPNGFAIFELDQNGEKLIGTFKPLN